ncbi:MAG TPA: phytanoyl-CoA dioxygenase family protein [Tepidisphaeraceae bacterium]|nr:phytanoyl-CoA dioxygenase family protein [Tepidisphaeraceae bacterium]
MTATISHPRHRSSRLADEQVAFYRREGYLKVPDPIFPQPEFDALKAHFEEKLAALPPDARPEGMDVPHFTDPKLFRWLLNDTVLDLVEPIIGPDIALFSSHFICKPKGDGRRVPWHEDSAYWNTMLAPMEVVTVWLAIDPSSSQNGAMMVIPRTFHGHSDYDPVDPSTHVFGTEIKKAQRDDSKAVVLDLQPNHASLHDGRLMHSSPPNTSAIRRCGYTMRYVPTHVKLNPASQETHHFYLARGKDKAGNIYGDPTVEYHELLGKRHGKHRNGH